MNKKFLIVAGLAIIGLMMLAPTATAETFTGTLVVKGSNTVVPVVTAAKDRWSEVPEYKDVTLDVAGPGSGAGWDLLIDGATDIAPMSRAPKDTEKADAAAAGKTVVETTVGLDALIIILNPDNPIDTLTYDQITDIYEGTVRDWTDVDSTADFSGFLDTSIKVIERDESSGTHDYFNEEFLEGGTVDSAALGGDYYAQYASTDNLFNDVASAKNAIGYGGLAYLSDIVKAVKVDDGTGAVEASVANAGDGSYPVSRPLFLVYFQERADELDLVEEFVNYVLSPEGQFLVLDVGYVNIDTAASDFTSVASEGDNAPLPLAPVFFGLFSITALVYMKKRY